MSRSLSVVLTLLLLLNVSFVRSQFAFHSVVTDHMVLQRAPASARIFGVSAPRKVISVQLDNTRIGSTNADRFGEWIFSLPPQSASYNHTITATDGDSTLTLADVAFGEVIFCSGQSNMQFSLINTFDGADAIANAEQYSNTIRVFAASMATSHSPEPDVVSQYGDVGWAHSHAQYLNGSVWAYFSGLCYLGGVRLTAVLGADVPLGLLDVTYGGTAIAAWSTADSLSACPEHPLPSYNTSFALATEINNAMIQPLTNLALAAVWWYQGESDSNSQDMMAAYGCRVRSMINGWRIAFRNPQLPFFQVILAGLPPPDSRYTQVPLAYFIAELRIQQQISYPFSEGTLATGIDVADPLSPIGAGHSRNKTIIGQRIANLTLAKLFADSPLIQSLNILTDGPAFDSVSYGGSCMPSCTVTFTNTQADYRNNGGLQLLDTASCTRCCAKSSPFKFVSASGAVFDAAVKIVNDSIVIVSASALDQPADYLNFMHEPQPECGLYNRDRWPMKPFTLALYGDDKSERHRDQILREAKTSMASS